MNPPRPDAADSVPAPPRARLFASAGLAVTFAGLAAHVALTEPPAWSPDTTPRELVRLTLLAGVAWALIAPALVDPHRHGLGAWLASGALAGAALAGPLAAGARLAFVPIDALAGWAARLLAVWLAASGSRAALERWTRRPGAHYLALAGAVALWPPAIDYLATEPLGARRQLPSDASPLEWLLWLDPGAPTRWLPLAAPLVAGLALVVVCRRPRALAAALVVALTLPTSAALAQDQPRDQDQGPRILDVDPLLGRVFRPGEPFPIAVRLRAGDTALDGELHLRWEGKHLHRRALDLAPDQTTTLWLYPTAPRVLEDATLAATLSVTADGRVIDQAERRFPVARRFPIAPLVGVFGAVDLTYFDELERAIADDRELRRAVGDRVHVGLRALPDRALGLAPFDTLIIGPRARLDSADTPAARALRTWIQRGGALFVASHEVARRPALRWLGVPPRWPVDPAEVAIPRTPRAGAFYGLPGGQLVFLTGADDARDVGLGRGMVLIDDGPLSPGMVRNWREGTTRLWRFARDWLERPARRRTPAPADNVARLVAIDADDLDTAQHDDLRRRLLVGLGVLLAGAALAAGLARHPRRALIPLGLAAIVGAPILAVRGLPAGDVTLVAVARAELVSGQRTAAVDVVWRASAAADTAGVARDTGDEGGEDDARPPDTLDLPATAEPASAVADPRRDAAELLRTPDRWRLPLRLRRGGARLWRHQDARDVLGGPLRLLRHGPATHLHNEGQRPLVAPALLDPDSGRARLLGDRLDAGLSLAIDRDDLPELDLDELARRLLPELGDDAGSALRQVLRQRRRSAPRLIIARADLAPPDLDGDRLRPPAATRAILLMPVDDVR